MKIGKITGLAIAAVLAIAVLAQDAAGTKPRRKKRMPRGPGTEIVLAPAQGPCVKVLDCQERVPASILDEMRDAWHKNVWLHSDYIKGGTREAVLADESCGIALCIVDKPGAETLLVSPEGRWVELNVAPLAADGASAEVLAKRVKREMWRALAYGMGVGNEEMLSVLNIITSVKDLDAIDVDEPTPDAFNHIIYSAAKRKMARVRYTTYRQACKEGWAPAPTNDAQRAVFEKAKAEKERGPTNPITIKPPKKK